MTIKSINIYLNNEHITICIFKTSVEIILLNNKNETRHLSAYSVSDYYLNKIKIANINSDHSIKECCENVSLIADNSFINFLLEDKKIAKIIFYSIVKFVLKPINCELSEKVIEYVKKYKINKKINNSIKEYCLTITDEKNFYFSYSNFAKYNESFTLYNRRFNFYDLLSIIIISINKEKIISKIL